MQAVPSQLKEVVGWPHGKLCKEVRHQGADNANTGASLSPAHCGLAKTGMQQLSGLSLSMGWAFGMKRRRVRSH